MIYISTGASAIRPYSTTSGHKSELMHITNNITKNNCPANNHLCKKMTRGS